MDLYLHSTARLHGVHTAPLPSLSHFKLTTLKHGEKSHGSTQSTTPSNLPLLFPSSLIRLFICMFMAITFTSNRPVASVYIPLRTGRANERRHTEGSLVPPRQPAVHWTSFRGLIIVFQFESTETIIQMSGANSTESNAQCAASTCCRP